MGTPATVLEARGVNNLVKGMASKSMVNLVLAVFVASVIGVTVAYPSNVQDILNSENAENKAKIEQILSHFPPNEQQDDSEDIEVCPLKAWVLSPQFTKMCNFTIQLQDFS